MANEITCPYCGAFANPPPSKTGRGLFWQLPRTSLLAEIRERAERIIEGENWWMPTPDDWDDDEVEASMLTETKAAEWILEKLNGR